MTRTVYAIFTEKLLLLTLKHGSIAEVCRQLKMNRQQFNRYLVGKSLPGASTLAKFAEFFHVPESHFFSEAQTASDFGTSDTSITSLFDQNYSCDLPAGVYALYSQWPPDSSKLLRGSILIDAGPALPQTFTRVFNFDVPLENETPHLKHEMKGVVAQNGQEIVFIGRELTAWNKYFGFFAFNHANRIQSGAMPGLGLAFLPTGMPLAVKLVLVRENGLNFEDAKNRPSLVPWEHEDITKENRSLLMPEGAALASLAISDVIQGWRS